MPTDWKIGNNVSYTGTIVHLDYVPEGYMGRCPLTLCGVDWEQVLSYDVHFYFNHVNDPMFEGDFDAPICFECEELYPIWLLNNG